MDAELRESLQAPPEVQRRLLRSILRQERERAGLTQKQAADRVLWSLSKMIRLENGVTPAAPADVRILLLEYGVPVERLAEVVELATLARRPDRLAAYRDVLTPDTLALFANEVAARAIMKYEASLVPGLLQIEEYARPLLVSYGKSPDEVDRLWQLRSERQEILTGENPPSLQFIIGEATLSRPVGSPAVMRKQIQHLKKLAKESNIELQLLPFSVGPHEGMGKAFTILVFKDTSLLDLVYLEDPDSETTYRDQPEIVSKYTKRFVKFTELALPADEFDSAVDQIAERLFPEFADQ